MDLTTTTLVLTVGPGTGTYEQTVRQVWDVSFSVSLLWAIVVVLLVIAAGLYVKSRLGGGPGG